MAEFHSGNMVALYQAGWSIAKIAVALGESQSRVRRVLAGMAEPLWVDPSRAEEPEEPELPRCTACGILLATEEGSCDEDGLCEDCQRSLEVVMRLTGLDRRVALFLWLLPPPASPDEPTALERHLATVGGQR